MVKTEAPLKIHFNIDKNITGSISVFDDDDEFIELGKVDFYIEKNTHNIKITWFYVHEAYRLENYGTLMMDILIAYSNIIKYSISLFSVPDAVGFYLKQGFQIINSDKDDITLLFFHS